ncbi:MAG: hypothetical protein V4472_25515 [Pseudomonadota bacterium]
MPIAPFQRQFRSLVFGASTSWGLEKVDEESLPPLDTSDMKRDRLDGSFTKLDLARTRALTYDFAIPNIDASYYANRETWRVTFAPVIGQALPLIANSPDWAQIRRIYARPRRRSQPDNNVSSTSLTNWSVVLEAPDPLWYADTATSVAAASSITIPNLGNWPGPGPTPSITTLTISTASTLTTSNGGSIVFAGTGPWTIDLATHIVTGGNGYTDIVQPSNWFLVDPGGITASVTAGTVACTTRDSWL